ncbi:N-acetyltransferase GCN5 [Aliidongia dinghuensis]|uniref:N-acetyltransferase GCN5 n=1 Tax=Aliidongia dinghuensis TaxID=1867774 RepID=A0A8J3E1X2_9PROT|nr:GNAT family N-acetyltransferase [Aliidongia dinghuensis]GGF15992.1 N-acetyltransferase GCN5 [Aliidongia dinghuensis]
MDALEIRPVGPDDLPLIEQLFGPRGACAGCWCMWWRAEKGGKDWKAAQGPVNRARFQALVEAGRVHGLLAFDGAEPVGWCDLAPYGDYGRLARARKLQRLNRGATWSIPCFFIKRGYRKQGVASRLLGAAVEHAWTLGAGEIEGYPVGAGPVGGGPAVDTFAYTGLPSMFEAAGFRQVPSTDQGSRTIYLKTR